MKMAPVKISLRKEIIRNHSFNYIKYRKRHNYELFTDSLFIIRVTYFLFIASGLLI